MSQFPRIPPRKHPLIGSIVDWPHGSLRPEPDWEFADGRRVGRADADHSEFFRLYGTAFGEGDGVDTYNMPRSEEHNPPTLPGQVEPQTVSDTIATDTEIISADQKVLSLILPNAGPIQINIATEWIYISPGGNPTIWLEVNLKIAGIVIRTLSFGPAAQATTTPFSVTIPFAASVNLPGLELSLHADNLGDGDLFIEVDSYMQFHGILGGPLL